MKLRKQTNRVVFHHSLTDTGSAESFRIHHVVVNGWEDIGYHRIIGRAGTIEDGRNLRMIGAHARHKNSDSIGVCLIGNFWEYEPTWEQLDAAQGLYHALCRYYSKTLAIEFHRVVTARNACPGPKLNREDFVEIVARGNPYLGGVA